MIVPLKQVSVIPDLQTNVLHAQ